MPTAGRLGTARVSAGGLGVAKAGARRLGVVAVVLSLLGGVNSCAGGPLTHQRTPVPPANPSATLAMSPGATAANSKATAGANPTAPASADTGRQRPLLPVPSVRPPGYADPPPGNGSDRYLKQSVAWQDCPQNPAHKCASVLVPLNYARPDEQAITLSMLKVPATQQPNLGTLFVNPGGPGEPGQGLASRFARSGLERYDIIGWDPRGTGASTPVRCEEGAQMDAYRELDQSPDDDAEKAAMIQGATRFGQSCLERSGSLLQHISTEETVHDLDVLRQLTGQPRLNFFGYSYGTEIGSRYAQEYPALVGKLVLDSAVNIGADDTVLQAQGFDRALEHFADWCVAQRCELGRDRAAVVRAITALFDRLDGHPLQVDQRQITQSLAVTGVITTLYGGESSWRTLLRAVQTAQAGDGTLLRNLAEFYDGRRPDGSYEARMYAFPAISCLDEPDHGIPEADAKYIEMKAKAPIFGPYFGPDYSCATWPVAALPKPVPPVARGAAPILVIGTTGDSATPYEYAVRMAQQLESGVLLTLNGEGHGAYGGKSECVDKAVVDYLTGPAPGQDFTCEH